MSIVPQTHRCAAAVCYRCTHVEPAGATTRCSRCGFVLITETSGQLASPPRRVGTLVSLPGMTPSALPRVPAAAVQEAGTAAPDQPARRGWLRRAMVVVGLCSAAVGVGAALAASIA